VYVITEACVDVMDQSCVRECPVDCIYEGVRQLWIHPGECIDCGACESVCPESAIYYEADLTPDLEPARDRATAVFLPLGLLGGARRHGALGHDHPDIAALPARPTES
jgi:NAD-dependent dihydropyrimidine dehydrogenase PreA subunit